MELTEEQKKLFSDIITAWTNAQGQLVQAEGRMNMFIDTIHRHQCPVVEPPKPTPEPTPTQGELYEGIKKIYADAPNGFKSTKYTTKHSEHKYGWRDSLFITLPDRMTNIEMTVIQEVELLKAGEETEIKLLGGGHGGSRDPQEGNSVGGGLKTDHSLIFLKEYKHPSTKKDEGGDLFQYVPKNRNFYIWKFIYRIVGNTPTLEVWVADWVDNKCDNNWRLLGRRVDNGDWHGPKYLEPQGPQFGGPNLGYIRTEPVRHRSGQNGPTSIYHHVSVREIDPNKIII